MKNKILVTIILLSAPLLAFASWWLFSITYRYVSPNEVMRNIDVKRSTVKDISIIEGATKSGNSWYEVTYQLTMDKKVADEVRARDVPFAPCSEKECRIENWSAQEQGDASGRAVLRGEVRCAHRSFEEIYQQRRQDVFCMGDGATATYRVYIPNAKDTSIER